MATRANIQIRSSGKSVWLYRHWDGYPSWLGVHLGRILDKDVRGRGFDIYQVASVLIKDEEDKGFELTGGKHKDIEYLYAIDIDTGKISVWRTIPFGNTKQDVLEFSTSWDTPDGIARWKGFCNS